MLEGTGGVWRVRTDAGETIDASLRGRLKKSNAGRRRDGSLRRDTVRSAAETLKLAVGDDVMLEHSDAGNRLGDRRDSAAALGVGATRAGRRAQGERIVAANVDQVVVMFAAAKPEPHLRMLDRFLVIAEGNDLAARIIVNKIDLVEPDAARERFRDLREGGLSGALHQREGRRRTSPICNARSPTCRTVITGPSGVGKSSLLNAIFPGAGLRVGAISESVNKGRHTTVGAIMLPLPGGRRAT